MEYQHSRCENPCLSTKIIIFAGKTKRHENSLGTLRGWHIPNPRPADGISAGTGVLLEMGGIASEANRNNIINNHSSIGREIATGVYQYLNNGTKPYIGPGYKCRYY